MSVQQDIKRIAAPDIRARKGGEPIVCLTSYHAHTARILDGYCDVILVGDSLGMVMHGLETTIPVTLEMMINHGAAVVRADAELEERIAYLQNALGGVPGPFDSFLTLRGIKTLALRMQRHCDSALAIANFLASHAKVERVYYPGLTSHPQHSLAKEQMHGRYGGIVTAVLRGDIDTTREVLERGRLFSLAESLGGVESLIEQPALMTHASLPAAMRATLGISDTLIRLSVGIEDPADLLAELGHVLS